MRSGRNKMLKQNRIRSVFTAENSKILLFLLSLHIALFPATPALAADPVSPADSVRGIWGLWNVIIIILSIARRKKEIGGWLLYYYVQLYTSAVFSVVILMFSFQNFLPMTWGGVTGLYFLFLLSTVSGILILFVELFFAERLRKSRNFDYLASLRIVLWIHLTVALLGLIIDLVVFQKNVPLAVIGLVAPIVWLPYFYYSKRVDRVFRTSDWNVGYSSNIVDKVLNITAGALIVFISLVAVMVVIKVLIKLSEILIPPVAAIFWTIFFLALTTLILKAVRLYKHKNRKEL